MVPLAPPCVPAPAPVHHAASSSSTLPPRPPTQAARCPWPLPGRRPCPPGRLESSLQSAASSHRREKFLSVVFNVATTVTLFLGLPQVKTINTLIRRVNPQVWANKEPRSVVSGALGLLSLPGTTAAGDGRSSGGRVSLNDVLPKQTQTFHLRIIHCSSVGSSVKNGTRKDVLSTNYNPKFKAQ